MSIKEDIEKVEKKMKKVEEESFALELIRGCKQTNKRLFIVLTIVLVMWFATICYLVYILNDIGTINDSIDIQDVESIDNSHIKIGDDIWEKSQ